MASQKDIAGEIADYMARSDEFLCLSVLPFFTFALSLSLGETGVLRTLSESGGRACVQSASFLLTKVVDQRRPLLVSSPYQPSLDELSRDPRMKDATTK
jgi:hypothetical protein